MNKHMRISLVIPVYNEADRIRDCLNAIRRQTVQPLEIIVVDNNSSDGTAAIARSFSGVRVLQESRQGVTYARDAGFMAARGDIIARIDADTLVASDWMATLLTLFTDPTLGAVSGKVSYREITAPRLVARLDLFWRRRMAHLLGDDVALQGANMAISREAWQTIHAQVCHKKGQHEDFDLAIHTNRAGFAVRFDERLEASVCYRQANYNLRSFSEYSLISPRTYLQHGVKSGRHMYQVVAFVIVLYPIISLLSKGYDQRLGRFSWAKVFAASLPARVNPATYVD